MPFFINKSLSNIHHSSSSNIIHDFLHHFLFKDPEDYFYALDNVEIGAMAISAYIIGLAGLGNTLVEHLPP